MKPRKRSSEVFAVGVGLIVGAAFIPLLAGCQEGDQAPVTRVIEAVWGDGYTFPPETQAELARLDIELGSIVVEGPDHLEEEKAHFRDALRRIRSDYVSDVDEPRLIDAAIKGLKDLAAEGKVTPDGVVEKALSSMMASLDPHSAYLNPDALNEMHVATSGEFGGLGIEIAAEEGAIKIVSPIEDTPAARAGLQPGDLITDLDGASIAGMALIDAVQRMRGHPGTSIVLTIQRGDIAPFDVTIVRDVIRIRAVRWHLEGDVGYVRVASFSEHAEEGVIEAMSELWASAAQGLSGVVLDLRLNPGGLLDQSYAVADAFLDDGVVVSVRGRRSRLNRVFEAQEGDVAQGLPMVVLVDGGSASAAEIVASSLQENGRAIVMGRRSYGKGSVQTIIPLPYKGALKLTTQLYYAPSGKTIQGKGVIPDITIDSKEVQKPPREADLPGALAADEPSERETHAHISDESCPAAVDGKDRMLGCAVEFLRAGSEQVFLDTIGRKQGG